MQNSKSFIFWAITVSSFLMFLAAADGVPTPKVADAVVPAASLDTGDETCYNGSWEHFLDALWQKEASSRLTPPDGDDGKAIGPYQIWEAYWIDAVEFNPEIGGEYQDCRDKEYAEQIVRAYMDRYANENRIGRDVTVEDMARIHCGGPNGFRRDSTGVLEYAGKFLEIYNSLSSE